MTTRIGRFMTLAASIAVVLPALAVIHPATSTLIAVAGFSTRTRRRCASLERPRRRAGTSS